MRYARMVAAAAVLLAGAIAFAARSQVRAAGAPSTAAASVQTRAVYAAPFRTRGLKGWSGGRSAWHTAPSGAITFDGTGESGILAPFSTRHVRDFAVQASIEAVGPPLQPSAGYGVQIRGAWPAHGIAGGSFFSPSAALNEPELWWGNDTAGGADVTLRPGYNTYRIEVHGADYTLLIDGRRITRFTIRDFAKGTKVGIWGYNQRLQVASFSVTRLGTVRPLKALPPVKTFNIGVGDIPGSLGSVPAHYVTNQELARVDNIPMSAVLSHGDVISYQTAFSAAALPGAGASSLSSALYAFTSGQMAQVSLEADWQSAQSRFSGNTNYRIAEVPGLGDQGYVVSYDYFAGSYDGSVVEVLFRRGSYQNVISESFVQGGSLKTADFIAQTTALAHTVDARIQQG